MSFDYGKYFGEIKLSRDLLTTPDERSWLLAPPRDGERHDVVLYLGCNVLRTSHTVQTAMAVFDRLGIDYVAAGGVTYCCGIQHHRYGPAAAGERFANHTIELLAKMAPREVVMWCPSCIHFYDDVHWGDPERILADATPCMAANGVNPETARGLVIKTFSRKS